MKKTNKQFIVAQQWMASRNFIKAIEILNKLLETSPSSIPYLMMRGEAYLRIENFDAGLTDFAQVVQVDNKNLVALNNFAVALIRSNKHHEAKEILQYLLELDPNNFDAYINLGNIHQTLFESQEAVNAALKALQINPRAAIAYNNLGTALGDLNHIEDARQAYITANMLDESNVSTYINLAQIEEKLGKRIEAKTLYEKVLLRPNITPNEAELVKYYLSYSYLYFGDLKRGWAHYDLGFGSLLPIGALRSLRKFSHPRWSGENLNGQKLLIWREQGLGDEIVFSTCLFDVASLGINVILECEPRLIPAYKRTFPQWQIRAELVGVDRYPIVNDFDLQCPLGSLPGIFRNEINDFNYDKTLFTPTPDLKEKYAALLAPYKDKLLVGISWRGGKLSVLRNNNYTSLLDWKEILKLKNCQFVNLQYGECEEELVEVEELYNVKIIRWPDLDLKNDLESVMALVSNLHHVVSVGTAIATIAPALGIHTIFLTQPSWLTLGEKDKFPWFDCVTPLIASQGDMVASKLELVPSILLKK